MKRLNKKGFLLVETLVVTVFILGIFTFVYTNVIPLLGEYEKAKYYDDIDSVYDAMIIRDMIKKDPNVADITALSTEYKDISDCDAINYTEKNYCKKIKDTLEIDKIYLVSYDLSSLQNGIKTKTMFATAYDRSIREYINSLPPYSSASPENINNKRIIIKRKVDNNGKKIIKYANIEVIL